MNDVRLPALTGDSPLGILAAIGTLRVLADFDRADTRLRWEPTTSTAVIVGSYADVGEIVAALTRIVESIPPQSLLPGVGHGFPPPGAAPDGLRVLRHDLGAADRSLFGAMSADEAAEGRLWLASLVTDLAVDNAGRVAISQFTAPSGKQSMATMLEKPLELVRHNADYLRQALEGWRRVPGVTGEYLDHRAMWDATEDGRGAPNMRGVPGATWLALMGYPLFRTTISPRKRAHTSGWHAVRSDTGRVYDELRLPVWEQPLGPCAVTALIEHPALWAEKTGAADDQLRTLGVLGLCRARRYQPAGGKSAGVLTTLR